MKRNVLSRFAHRLDQQNTQSFAYQLIVPVLIFFAVWNLIPVLWMIGLGFYNFTLTSARGVTFSGFENYAYILGNSEIWASFSRTFVFVFFAVTIETLLGVSLAFLFWGSTNLPGRRFALTMLFSPMIVTPVASGTFFRLILDPVFGIANYFIDNIFGIKIDFLGDPAWAFPSVLAVDIWMWTPFMILMGLAALGSVPKAELEAAAIDRLPWYTRLLHVILPHGKFILMLGVLLRTIEAFKTMGLIHTMTSGGPGNATELIAVALYRQAFQAFKMGRSSAMAILTLMVAIAFTSIFLYILNFGKRKGDIQ
ncbi:MAG: sugar ABC transporter permease [Spirochaeta sp.]|nr:sugar ABC transporter permease [Spirochaeta sp.]